MAKVDRYVFRQVALALLSIATVLTLVIWLAYSLRFLDYIVNRGLPLDTFLSLIALMLPQFLALALPIALVCAVLFTYFRLMTDSELVVLRATGLSDLRLAAPALTLAMIVMLMVALLNLQIAPMAARAFRDLQFAIRNSFPAILAQPGVFRTLGDGLTFHVRAIGEGGEFTGVLMHDASDRSKQVTLISERGRLVQSEEGPRIVLRNGNRQEFDRASGKLSLLYFDRYTVDLGLAGGNLTREWRTFEERSLGELLTAAPEDVGRRNVAKFRAEGHARLVSIGYAPAFTSVALAVLLLGELNRRGFGRRVAAAALLPLGILTASFALKGLAAKTPEATPLFYLVVLAPLASSLYLLVRSRRHGPPRRDAHDHRATAVNTG